MTDPVIIPGTTDYLRDLAARVSTPSDAIRLRSVVEVLEAMNEVDWDYMTGPASRVPVHDRRSRFLA